MVFPSLARQRAAAKRGRSQRCCSCSCTTLQKYLVAVVALVSAAFILKSSSLIHYYSPFSSSVISEDDGNNQRPPDFYASARGDLAGAVIHDMLLAHAYGYQHNLTYGGACFEFSWRKPFRKPRGYVVKLMRSLQMTKVLKYACPPRGGRESSHGETTKSLILPKRVYRDLDAALLTPAWRHQIRSELHIREDDARYKTDATTTAETRAKASEIVVHVRRGDIDPCISQDRYLPNSHFLKLIDRYSSLMQQLDNETATAVAAPAAHVTIYSESESYEPFDVFVQKGYTVKLDSDLTECYQHMMVADVLILSRSSFSYVPAILNAGIVVYTPFRHGPLSDWHVVDDALMQESLHELDTNLTPQACASTTTYTKLKRFVKKLVDSINVNTFGL